MADTLDSVLIIVLLLNFFLLGTSQMSSAINISASQGVVLGVATVFAHGQVNAGELPSLQTVLIAIGATVMKGMAIPTLLRRALRDVPIRREIDPVIGFIPSLLLGAFGTASALMFSRTLPLVPEHTGSLLVPTSLATVFTGFVLLTMRRKAITQVTGFLVLENGIFIMGLTLLDAMPFLVEIGVLLDLFVGIFVMGILINHISREFSSIDTGRLTQLKDT